MVTVHDVAVDASGAPVPRAAVLIDLLVGPKSVGLGFLNGETIGKGLQLEADADGSWSTDLVPQSEIVPDGTVYRVRYVTGAGGAFAIIVPASGGPYTTFDLLAELPTTGPASAVSARNVAYDNTLSGLDATNVQDAIDEGGGGGGGGAITLTGDVSGHPTSTQVDKIKGIPVAGTRGAGKALVDDGTSLTFTDVATQAELDAEASTRASGDSTNATAITAEATARAGAITTEAAARVAGDTLAVPLTQKAAASGVASLDGSGRIPAAQLPSLVLSHTFVVGSQAAMLALSTANTGDVAVRTDNNETFILSGADPSILGNWTQLLFPGGGAVNSVNTRTGAVVGLAEQSALDSEATTRAGADTTNATAISTEASRATAAEALLAPKASPTFTGHPTIEGVTSTGATGTGKVVFDHSPALITPTGIVKGDVGLGNVDNTSDANKPVSTAQQTALNLKANLISPALVTPDLGVPSAIDLTHATNTPLPGAGTVTSSMVLDGTLVDADVNAAAAIAATKIAGTALVSAAIGTTVQGYSAGVDAVAKSQAGTIVPIGALDRVRGAVHPAFTNLNGAIADTTTAAITVRSPYFTTAGVSILIGFMDGPGGVCTERALTVSGEGTTSLVVARGVDGTTAQTHADGCVIATSGVREWLFPGDSTVQGTTTAGAVGQVGLIRQIADTRFGGSLGAGFFGVYLDTGLASNTADHTYGYGAWLQAGTWGTTPTDLVTYWQGWYASGSSGSASDILTFYCPAGEIVQQADLWFTEYIGFNNNWSWRYTTDGTNFSAWTANPNTPTYPAATTTLNVADNGRNLSYWDGTKTMTIASTSGYPTAGYFELFTTGGTAKFSYAGVTSGTVLANVKLVRGSGAWTSATSQVVKLYPTGKRAILNGFVGNPLQIQVRAADAVTQVGTSKSSLIVGIDLWSTAEAFGRTVGTKVHNWGKDGATLQDFLGSVSYDDCVATNGQATITSAKGGTFSANFVNAIVQHPNFPAGTTVLSSGSTLTLSANATVPGGGSTTIAALGTFLIQIGDFGRYLNGSAASTVADFICVQFTNDMGSIIDRTVTGTITAGVLIVSGSGSNVLYANDTSKVISGANVTAGSTITFTDSTHAAVTGTTTAASTTITINHLPANVVAIYQNNLTSLYNRVHAHADMLIIAPFEQGGTRLDGSQCTSAIQAQFRTGIQTWAAANNVAVKNIYDQWAAYGITGYTQSVTAGYVVGGGVGFHQDQAGLKNEAAAITRELQDF